MIAVVVAVCLIVLNFITDKREQINSITAFIDASSVYGSSLEEEEELRESDGHGEACTT